MIILAAGNSGLTFLEQMIAIKTANKMIEVGLNISQLRILLWNLWHKIGAKMFEHE